MPSIVSARITYEDRVDSALYVVLECTFTNEDPERYALSSLHIYCDDRLLVKRGIPLDFQGGGTMTEPLYIDSPPKGTVLTFRVDLVGYDRYRPPPREYAIFDSETFTYTVQTEPAPPPTEAIVTLYTDPILPPELTLQVSAQLDGYTLTVGKGVWVPIGSTFKLTVTSLPPGYTCYGAYGTGKVSISDWTVTVNGNGNIVLKLTPPTEKLSPWVRISAPIVTGASMMILSETKT